MKCEGVPFRVSWRLIVWLSYITLIVLIWADSERKRIIIANSVKIKKKYLCVWDAICFDSECIFLKAACYLILRDQWLGVVDINLQRNQLKKIIIRFFALNVVISKNTLQVYCVMAIKMQILEGMSQQKELKANHNLQPEPVNQFY